MNTLLIGNITTQEVTSEREILLPLTVKMEIEVSRRKIKCAIVNRQDDIVGWYDSVHECFHWLSEAGIDRFYCDSPSGKWEVQLKNIPRQGGSSYG